MSLLTEWARFESARAVLNRFESARVEWAQFESARAEWAQFESSRAEWARFESTQSDWARVESVRAKWSLFESAGAKWAWVEWAYNHCQNCLEHLTFCAVLLYFLFVFLNTTTSAPLSPQHNVENVEKYQTIHKKKRTP